MDIVQEVLAAEQRIRPYIRRTYLEPSPFFSEISGANVYFKCENLQHTGSFKARGALSKLLSLREEERARGVVTASTGNHGAAVAFALSRLKASGTVYVPHPSASSKVEAIRRLGAQVEFFGQDSVQAEAHARQVGTDRGLTYISPYNDPQIIGGQGTIGIELSEQLDPVDAVFVAVGGGGLIAGIAGYLKSLDQGVKISGCSPENSKVMMQSVQAGKILDLPSLPTLSDGTAGGVEAGSITFEPCRDLVDDYVSVSEEEIRQAFRQFLPAQHMLIEGSAAVPLAALLKNPEPYRGRNVVIVLCGANIDPGTLAAIIGSTT
jgi:threonine dehydratase